MSLTIPGAMIWYHVGTGKIFAEKRQGRHHPVGAQVGSIGHDSTLVSTVEKIPLVLPVLSTWASSGSLLESSLLILPNPIALPPSPMASDDPPRSA